MVDMGRKQEKEEQSSNEPPERASWVMATSASSLGIEMALVILILTGAGYWLEKNVTHWSPWTMLIGLGMGCVAAAKAILRSKREYEREFDRTGLVDARDLPPEEAAGSYADEDPDAESDEDEEDAPSAGKGWL